jgi:excisionase family DNA binding protein
MITSNKQTSNHNLMTVKETSELLRIPIPTVYYHIKKGTIPTIRIGGRWRILRDRLNSEFLKIVPDDHFDMKQTNDEQEFIDAMVDKVIQALRLKILQRN